MFFKSLLKPNLLPPGEAAPPFRLIDQHGETIGLEDILEQSGMQGAVLVFFATDTDASDRKLLKDYAGAYDAFKSRGYEVLALCAVNWETLHHLANELSLPYRVLFDPCTRVAKQYRACRLPGFITGQAVFLVDRVGCIRIAEFGPVRPDELISRL